MTQAAPAAAGLVSFFAAIFHRTGRLTDVLGRWGQVEVATQFFLGHFDSEMKYQDDPLGAVRPAPARISRLNGPEDVFLTRKCSPYPMPVRSLAPAQ